MKKYFFITFFLILFNLNISFPQKNEDNQNLLAKNTVDISKLHNALNNPIKLNKTKDGFVEDQEEENNSINLIVFNKTGHEDKNNIINSMKPLTNVEKSIDKDDILKVSNDDVMDPYYFEYGSPFNTFKSGYRIPDNGYYYNNNPLQYFTPYYNNYGSRFNNNNQMNGHFPASNNFFNQPYGSNMHSRMRFGRYPLFNYNEGYDSNPLYNNNNNNFNVMDNYKMMPNIKIPPFDENLSSYENHKSFMPRNNDRDEIKPKKTQTFRSLLTSKGNIDLDLNYDEDYDMEKNTESSSTINAPITSLLHGVPMKTKKPKPEKGVMMSNGGYSYAAYIERQANMYPIMMYTLIKCVPCQRAKHLLAVQYSDVRSHFLELAGDEDWQRQLQVDLQHITGALTFPYIFLCGNYIGGASDLFQLHQQGQLRRIVNACNPKL
uniref:Glutaredoxin domain-containing protein n=1 Tax=Strongyloides stercoralis TaxID=6248 RepID=A0A0K0DSB6_STRER